MKTEAEKALALGNLLELEQDEQATWKVSIPEWHPRNEAADTSGTAAGIVEAGGGSDDDGPLDGGPHGSVDPREMSATPPTALPVEREEPAPAAEEPAPAAEPSSEDRLLQALNGFGERLGQFEERLEAQAPAAPAAEPVDEGPSMDELMRSVIDELPDENFDESGVLTPEGNMAAMVEAARQAARAEVLSELAPEREQRESERITAEANALEQRYPQLADPAVQDEVLAATAEFCAMMGRPELAREPAMVEKMYLAREGQQRGAAETPASGVPSTRLERGSAAAPAVPAQQPSEAQRIVDRARSSKFRLDRS